VIGGESHKFRAYKMEDPHVPFLEEVQAILRKVLAYLTLECNILY
jgi:hypothetical protein